VRNSLVCCFYGRGRSIIEGAIGSRTALAAYQWTNWRGFLGEVDLLDQTGTGEGSSIGLQSAPDSDLDEDMAEERTSTNEGDQATVDIHYIKTPDFREVACDGALGGPTPRGKLWLAFYNERFPLPRVVQHQLTPAPAGDLTIDESKPGVVVETRRGVVRSVEFGVYLDLDTAAKLHRWLGNYLTEASSSGEKK